MSLWRLLLHNVWLIFKSLETETNNSFYCWTSVQTSPLMRRFWFESLIGHQQSYWVPFPPSQPWTQPAVSIPAIRIKAFQPVSEGESGTTGEQWRYYWPVVVPLLPEGNLDTGNMTVTSLYNIYSNLSFYLNCILTSSIFSKLLTNRLTQTMVGPSMLSVLALVTFWASPWGKSASNKCFYTSE